MTKNEQPYTPSPDERPIPSVEFVRRHYAKGPVAYYENGRPVRWPTPDEVAFNERQFDRMIEAVRAEAWSEGFMAGRRADHNPMWWPNNPYRKDLS